MTIRAAILVLPLCLLLAGRFLPGPAAWGVNHLAYLPVWAFAVWLALAGLILVPAVQRRLAAGLSGGTGRAWFDRPAIPLALAILSGGLFTLLRERSFFMGDGYLIGELIERGMQFRAFDNLDYLLHHQLYTRLHEGGSKLSSFDLYRLTSILVGAIAVWLWTRLAARLPWETWRRNAVIGFLFLIGPTALFFGYVESYTFLFLFLTAFLLQGLRVLEGNGRLWVASAFFGAGLAFHLTAVFTGPALLYLALRAPVRPASRRWLEAVLPPLILFALSIALHVAEGYNSVWFRREFIEAQNTKHLWIPFDTKRGLFSLYHWKDLLNLALITAPAALMVLLMEWRGLRARWREPRVLFLLLPVATLILASLLLDRKLGGARDWDLFAAHAGAWVLLAALVLPEKAAAAAAVATPEGAAAPRARRVARSGKGPESVAAPATALALGVSFLCAAPWVLLLHLEPRSIDRFVSVAADFPDFQRGYAYEEVGKYYRKSDDIAKAERLYELAIEANPSHARLRVLMGSIYYAQSKYDQAEEQYRAALQCDPRSYMAAEMLGKVALQKKDLAAAAEWFRKLVDLRPNEASAWELYGYTALRVDSPEEAVRGLTRAMALDPKLDYRQDLGVALIKLGRFDEAAQAFASIVRGGNDLHPDARLALAFTRFEQTRTTLDRGGRPSPEWAREAETQLRELLSARPGDPQATDLLGRLQHLTR